MRILSTLVLGSAIFAGMLVIPPPARAACETVDCSTECWWVGPNTRRCQRRCTRRCWNDAPRYYAPPSEPSYAPAYQPVPQFSGPLQIDPAVFLAGLVVLAIGFVAFLVGAFNTQSIDAEIASVEQSAADARALARDAQQKTGEIDNYIATVERDAFQQGRKAADDEWDSLK